jgi:hypothetical protein
MGGREEGRKEGMREGGKKERKIREDSYITYLHAHTM